MGTFTFQWPHPASDVFVTGTFDGWGKTVKLDKRGSVFEKLVDLPNADSNIYYKFVVDGVWTTDHTAPQEIDGQNNLNNVLTPERIDTSNTPSAGFAAMSTVTPDSTTVELAKNAPKSSNSTDPSGMPGDFPETPFQEPSEFSVKPIPATAGPGNPVQLQPGEKVPEPQTLTANTVSSTATTDKESYEKGGSAVNAPPVLPDVVTPQVERDQKGYGVLDMPPVSNNMIPESSLPMGTGPTLEKNPGPFISSAAPQSTTASLAAKVPVTSQSTSSSHVPGLVKESQTEAHVEPEASGSVEAVDEKAAVEQELKQKISEEPSTAEGTSHGGAAGSTDKKEESPSTGKVTGIATGATAAAGGAAYNAATTAKDKTAETTGFGGQSNSQGATGGIADSIMKSINQMNAEANRETTGSVPGLVQESINKAHEDPEAAGNREAVHEKQDVERELLNQVHLEEGSGKPAPSAAPALSSTAPTVTRDNGPETGTPALAEDNTTKPAPLAKDDNLAVRSSAKPAPISKDDGLAAGAYSQASTPATKRAEESALDSRDVSPMTKGPSTQPMVTSGVGESKTDKVTGPPTPLKDTPSTPASAGGESSSPSSAAAKKEKRKSGFFGKLKEKLKK
ncbi:MAG: hypothetical protein M1837_006121 [Sclerophora amabilis]|nr:MAG: hypothetical protein M1837_006121 [Sclerophora amabilis]